MSDLLSTKKKISTAHAAKFLGVSRWTLRRWGDRNELPFTTSASGYRYYKAVDLIALKEKHTIVRVPKVDHSNKAEAVSHAIQSVKQKEETILLPVAPVPHEPERLSPVEPQVPIEPPQVAQETPPQVEVPPVQEASMPDLIVPQPPLPPKKKSVFSKLLKILPFTGASIFLFFAYSVYMSEDDVQPEIKKLVATSLEHPTSILSKLSFRDVVLAAATDSGQGASLQFFLSKDTEPINAMLSPESTPPAKGNTNYLSSLTTFSNFQESPFAYLNGSHGVAGPVAIIDNADSLRSHPFFADVHNGDKLLIYKDNAKAILFRPLTNEVIAFAPLDAIPSETYEETTGHPVVALRNGMGTPYDMKTFEAELTFVSPTSVVVDNQQASRSDYKKSFIVDISGNKKVEAQELARRLKLQVSTLPEGEYRPQAGVDFLVVLGKDRISLMNYIAPSSTASATPAPKP